ncbi:RDD family protein [Paenibacillus segetis]|uniref:RDD domain-containing protein n=1 Tax=Paenibacillus segetis TaxID=1325360 RepID=A0ABQ1YU43_9BACL|nr:RDD family protein [Paenibacillus segetis]GGH37156.1 hypothetical protein GCM10008013_44450 [Paenibacillus segetis]
MHDNMEFSKFDYNRHNQNNQHQHHQEMIYHNPNPDYVGFWVRFLAYLIDVVILEVLSWIWPFNVGIISWMIGFVYFTYLPSTPWQGTIGKLIVGAKIVDEEGNRISYLHSIGRYLSSIVSGLILCIGFLMIAFTDQKRGLHDYMAGTYVLKKESQL